MPKLFLSLTLSLFLLTSSSPAYAHPWQYHVGGAARAHEDPDRPDATDEDEDTNDDNNSDSNDSTDEDTDEAQKESEERGEEIKTKVEEFKKELAEKQLAKIKEVCEKMVAHRLKELAQLKEKVEKSDLSTAQKNEIEKIIEDKEKALTDSKEDCEAEDTVDETNQIARDVEDNHHIFASVLPKLHALRFLDKATAFVGRLTNHTATIQKHIDKAKDDGCNTTEAEASLAAYKTAIQSAQTHLNEAKEIIASFKDTEDPGTKREQLKTEMTAMKEALHDARDAHKEIIKELKACREADESEPED